MKFSFLFNNLPIHSNATILYTFHDMRSIITQKGLELKLRILTEKHLPVILKLQDVVYNDLPQKNLLIKAGRKFILEHLRGKSGKVWGILNNDRLIAFSILHFPGTAADNLGLDIGLPKKELRKVVHLEIYMVHPDFRGHGLQLILCKTMLAEAKKKKFCHIFATVAPKNTISRKNLEKVGLAVATTKLKYGKNKRDIMYMHLK